MVVKKNACNLELWNSLLYFDHVVYKIDHSSVKDWDELWSMRKTPPNSQPMTILQIQPVPCRGLGEN